MTTALPAGDDARRLLKMRQVAARLGVSERKCWRLLQVDPDFPRPVKVGKRGTRFFAPDVDDYVNKLAGRQL
jgi:predicted DNA-binding transcriptional regulator AlpA